MIDLSFEELENFIDEISTGIKIIDVENRNGIRVFLLFKQPSSEDKLMATYIYKQTYQKAIDDGLPTREEMAKILKDRGLFTSSDEDQLVRLRAQLDAQRALLAKTTRVKARRERILGIIKNLEDQAKEILLKKERNFSITAEAKASEEKLSFLCCRYIFSERDSLFWPTEEDYNKFTDHVLRSNILVSYSEFFSGLPVETIRYIARSNLWRIRYLSATKCGCDLFGIPIVDYSVDMISLLYWSHFYQGIYEMMPEDQPTDDIIEDDSALDAYMDSYYKEIRNDRLARKSSKGKGKIDAMQSEQVIITPAHELHQDIEYDKPREALLAKDKNLIREKSKKRR